jgi:VWFA-related protein
LAVFGAVVQTQDRQPFRSTADAVRVDVSVQRGGSPVAGLTLENFELLSDGVPQQIADLSVGRLPIDVTVALDVSSSVSGQLLADLRDEIGQLTSRLGGGDRLKLMVFNMRVRRLMDFGGRDRDATSALNRVSATGGTSLLDTIAVALTSAAPEDRRQLVIVFSDGADTSSISSPAVLLEVARRTTPTVAFVGPMGTSAPSVNTRATGSTPAQSSGTVPMPTGPAEAAPPVSQSGAPLSGPWTFLARIARETGGVVMPLPALRSANLRGAFGRVMDDFRSSYVLYFTPRGVPERGAHTLQVMVRGAGNVTVRARSGYVDD